MPTLTDADTIRILVSTDNHVGYNERDPIRGDDSWKSFHEVMCLAKERDVDMVLLAGDLFHENKPSRKSMYQVMRSIRMNCLGDKPCELEMLSDASENFQGAFDHVNYEDPDINVGIPVFSIHGNHDDPSGEANLAALDLLQISGLINYYGRTPESDNIIIKPVLLQKGRTKLALYGMSNVRDERLFRTFRDGNVRFFQPSTQKGDWFNLMSVHQNHFAHTETGYLPETFLPDFLDLVVWGHEHECLIEPRYNPEMSFHVMQPGSSVATSLMPGEAVPKHVAIVSITGKEFKVEPIRLKTIRPFVMKDIILSEEKALKHITRSENNRTTVTKHLSEVVEEMIKQADQEWHDAQTEEDDHDSESAKPPLPLIRLRVEYSAPDGGKFDCENPQRFSNRFIDKVANVNDVVSFYRKKAGATRKSKDAPDMPEDSVLAKLEEDVQVHKLVREYLAAQKLTLLPQNLFGDAVSQFIDKDDKHAVDVFVNESLSDSVKHLMGQDQMDEDIIAEAMDEFRSKMEEMFAEGKAKTNKKRKLKPKPANWDTDMDGDWAEDPAAIILSDDDDEMEDDESLGSVPPRALAARGRGRGGKVAASTRKTAASASKAAPATRGSRAKKPAIVEEDEDEDEDEVVMLDDDDDDEEELFVKPKKTAVTKKAPARAPAKRTASPAKKAPVKAKQSTLNFSQPSTQTRQTNGSSRKKVHEISDDEISDDDAFEPAPLPSRSTRARR